MNADHTLGRVLLIGAGGMLGRAWSHLLERADAEHSACDRDGIDLADRASINAGVTPGTQTVVNCAAWTDVDGAEEHEPEAAAVNAAGAGALARRCAAVGARLVHYSTDYVFNGKSTRPYRVDDPIEPVNAYGRTKAEGERLIRESGCEHLIIRTSWIYAPWGKNFVRTMARLMRRHDKLNVVDDQRGRPTSAQWLADATASLLARSASGTYHVCDGGECTWHAFAAEIARLIGADCAVEPCSSDQFPRPAPRPTYSVLDLSSTEALIGPAPLWTENLTRVVDTLED